MGNLSEKHRKCGKESPLHTCIAFLRVIYNPYNSCIRNIQITKVRELFLSNKYPSVQLARCFIEKDSLNDEAPEIVDSLRETIPTLPSMQALLFSDHMYQHQLFYEKWCKAFESGVLRGTNQTTPQPIEYTLSPWHEAHFRLPPICHSFLAV
jgi:hypothetical protein